MLSIDHIHLPSGTVRGFSSCKAAIEAGVHATYESDCRYSTLLMHWADESNWKCRASHSGTRIHNDTNHESHLDPFHGNIDASRRHDVEYSLRHCYHGVTRLR